MGLARGSLSMCNFLARFQSIKLSSAPESIKTSMSCCEFNLTLVRTRKAVLETWFELTPGDFLAGQELMRWPVLPQ